MTQAISLSDTTNINYNGNIVSELRINGTAAWVRETLKGYSQSVIPMKAYDMPYYRAALNQSTSITIANHKGTTVTVNGIEVGASSIELTSEASVRYTPGELSVVRSVYRNTTDSKPVKLILSGLTLVIVAK